MRGVANIGMGLLLGVFGASSLRAQDAADIKDALAQLESPFADERALGKAELVAAKGDIARQLRAAMDDSPECVQAELLDVAQSRRDGALVQHAAALLATSNVRLLPAARDYLLALKRAQLQVNREALGEALRAWDEFIVFRRRYEISLELIEAQFKPGKYTGQFSALRADHGDALDEDLLALVSASDTFGDALFKAATDRVASGIPAGDVIRNARFRRISNPALVLLALQLIGRGAAEAEIQQQLLNVEASAFAGAVYMVQDLRVTAVRALALTSRPDEMSDRLAALHATVCRDSSVELFKRLLDQDALREEVEIALARFGRTELLQARVGSLRQRYERPATGQVAAASGNAAEVETQSRNSIAYLYMRAGDAASAESEWFAAAEQVKARMNGSGGRVRTSLAVTLGAIYYNLACAQSTLNKTTRALGSLRKAVENGYAEYGWMLEDGDLESVRGTRAFEDWFVSVAPPSVSDYLAERR